MRIVLLWRRDFVYSKGLNGLSHTKAFYTRQQFSVHHGQLVSLSPEYIIYTVQDANQYVPLHIEMTTEKNLS